MELSASESVALTSNDVSNQRNQRQYKERTNTQAPPKGRSLAGRIAVKIGSSAASVSAGNSTFRGWTSRTSACSSQGKVADKGAHQLFKRTIGVGHGSGSSNLCTISLAHADSSAARICTVGFSCAWRLLSSWRLFPPRRARSRDSSRPIRPSPRRWRWRVPRGSG